MPVTFKTKLSEKPWIHRDVVEQPDEAADAQERRPRLDRRINLDARIKAECVEILDIDAIHLKPRNAKKHPEYQIARLAEVIEELGFNSPIAVDERGTILAGEARYLAARRIGLPHLPVVRLKHLSAAQKRAFAIADNRLADLGEFDPQVLSEELSFLFSESEEITFDPRIIGFDTAEADQIMLGEDDAGEESDPADRIPLPAETAVTAAGDIWICGKHKLCCGDATSLNTYRSLLPDEVANIVFIDPPFNVPNAGHVTDREGVREFAMAHGEMSPKEFTGFLSAALTRLRETMTAGAVIYICMDWRHLDELSAAARPLFGAMKNLVIWVKKNAGMGSFYRSQHELIAVYATPGKVINNFGLGAKGRHRTNVWKYAGLNSFGRGRDESLAMHPTVKPVAMVADALRDCSKRNDIVLDAFSGSGTTMIAAEKTGRRARLIEIDPLYCDVIVKRWQEFAGDTALLAETGETFDEVKTRRGAARNKGDDHDQEIERRKK
jgi:DNA modification methylase